MKKIEVRPEKVRGMGNLIPPLSVSDFELSDCLIHEEDPFKINGHLFNHFSIDVPVVPVNLVLSTNVATIYPDATTPDTAVITATLTDSSGTPVSNVDVYFQEEGVRIGTASTNAQGVCTFEYSNSGGGTHTIRAYTMKQGKYNKSSAEINVNVYMPTSLSLSPVSTIANTVDIVTLSSKIIDQNDLPLAGKLIDLYRGDVKIKSAYSNSKGVVEFDIEYSELLQEAPGYITISAYNYLIGETGDLILFEYDTNLDINTGEWCFVNADTNEEYSLDFEAQYKVVAYLCAGRGDVPVKVKYKNGTNIIESNTLTLEDCLICDSMTYDSGNWVSQDTSKVNITAYDSNKGAKIQALTDNSLSYRVYYNKILPTGIVFEWEIGSTEKATNDNTPMRFGIFHASKDATIISGVLNYKVGHLLGGTWNRSVYNWEIAKYQLIFTPTTQILKKNGVTLVTKTNDYSSYEQVRIGFHNAYSSYFWCRNVKVKPYSE